MPWCDTCDKYLAPNALNPDGSCPTCESSVDTNDLKEAGAAQAGSVEAEAPTAKAPWHFWLMVIALVLYLGWRLIQLAMWGIEKL